VGVVGLLVLNQWYFFAYCTFETLSHIFILFLLIIFFFLFFFFLLAIFIFANFACSKQTKTTKTKAAGETAFRSKSAVRTQSKSSVLSPQPPPTHETSHPVVGDAAVVFQNTPSAPTDVSTAIVSSRFITVTWARPVNADETNINGYSIYYKRQDSNRERVVNSTRGNLEEVNIQGLQPGTNYAFRVVAYNDHGSGDSSEVLSVKTDDELDVPGAVTDLEAKATSSFSVLVTWGQPSHSKGPITGYKLYYRQVS
jgi:hypothetical protein